MYAEINGKKIAYEVIGDGEPMIMVHGLGGTQNFWWSTAKALGNQFRIILPDLPSAGRSQVDSNLSISSLAKDILALMDALSINQAHVVGHSMGTIVCQQIAAMAPERVIDLVLLGPLAQPPEPARPALKDRASLARKEGMMPVADAVSNAALSTETKIHNANIQGFVREMLMAQDPEGYALSCEALAEATRAEPEKITCPCLLITGDQDAVAPIGNVKLLGSEIGKAEVHVLEQCGHWTPNEKPDEVNSLMAEFYSNQI